MKKITLTPTTFYSTRNIRKNGINVRYKDLENLNVPSWILKPFESNIADIDFSLQEEFIELGENLELKINFQTSGYVGVEKTFAQNTSD